MSGPPTTAGRRSLPVFSRQPPFVFQQVLNGEPGQASAYCGISIDSALNLRQAYDYRDLNHNERVQAALADEHRLLESFLDFAGRAAADLRLQVWPDRPNPVQVSVLGRAWAENDDAAIESASALQRWFLDAMPQHVFASAIDDPAEVLRRLNPYGNQPLRAAIITKHELIDPAPRVDAPRAWNFSVARFEPSDLNWMHFYDVLSRSRHPVSVALGLFPVMVPPRLRQVFSEWETYYQHLARSVMKPSIYYGHLELPPDQFAAEAQRDFAAYLESCSERAYVMRVQIAGPALGQDVVEALRLAISPARPRSGSRQPVPGCEVRWLTGQHGHQTAHWNLAAVDCYPAPGRPEIWARPDRLPQFYEILAMLGGVHDAHSTFRMPIAPDERTPGIAVRRARLGPRSAVNPEADVVVLTATPVESEAFEQSMATAGYGPPRLIYGRVNTYSLYGPIAETVVAHVRCSMGSGGAGAASLTVRDAIQDLQPWAVLAVGIAFGIREAEQPIGQLLLSESLSAYELQRVGESSTGDVIIDRGPTVPGSPTLLGRFRDSHLAALGFNVLAGEMLSGEKLIDNAGFKQALLGRYPGAVGGEMEGAGLVAASHREAVHWLVVKAVCDYAESKGVDKEARQRLAADVAVRAVFAVISQGAFVRPD